MPVARWVTVPEAPPAHRQGPGESPPPALLWAESPAEREVGDGHWGDLRRTAGWCFLAAVVLGGVGGLAHGEGTSLCFGLLGGLAYLVALSAGGLWALVAVFRGRSWGPRAKLRGAGLCLLVFLPLALFGILLACRPRSEPAPYALVEAQAGRRLSARAGEYRVGEAWHWEGPRREPGAGWTRHADGSQQAYYFRTLRVGASQAPPRSTGGAWEGRLSLDVDLFRWEASSRTYVRDPGGPFRFQQALSYVRASGAWVHDQEWKVVTP